jgi:hypothetical protein
MEKKLNNLNIGDVFSADRPQLRYECRGKAVSALFNPLDQARAENYPPDIIILNMIFSSEP